MPKQKQIYTPGQKMGNCIFLNEEPPVRGTKDFIRMAKFKCECGKEFITQISGIKNGHTKSCGCFQKIAASTIKSLYDSGDKIGQLIFVKRSESKPRRPEAIFRCDCGKEFKSRIDSVKEGRIKSCGCKTSELRSKSLTKYEPLEYFSDGKKKMPILNKDIEFRFWSKVTLTANPDKCWEWQATGQRYGEFAMGKGMYKASRIAYFLHYKEDPGELEVMHSCDNPKCCNPNHLSLGTHFENMQDMVEKGRSANGAISPMANDLANNINTYKTDNQ